MKKTIFIAAMMLFGITAISNGVLANMQAESAVETSVKKCKITVKGTYNENSVDGTVEVEGMTCAELIKALMKE